MMPFTEMGKTEVKEKVWSMVFLSFIFVIILQVKFVKPISYSSGAIE